ncbi:MAG: putative cysteine desulfurase [Propionibacteriaceae bacterium]|nr:putative cysteine desulfurase [Propionibacteriaceae bacterium]
MSRIYLDHAATTPMVPAAIEAMARELARVGNASSQHGSGRAARRVVEESREAIAACVGARPAELIFTSGGTESDNLAVKGSYWSARKADPGRSRIVASTIEHHAVLDSVGWLAESQGAVVQLLEVNQQGLVDLDDLAQIDGSDVATVSVMWANNEVGAVQPVPAIAAWAASVGARSHSDAVQAVGRLPVDFGASGLDLLTFTAHKLGGPYGVGALLARREVSLTSVAHGGGQERDVRSGTFDVAAIAGFAAAVQHATGRLAAESERLRVLRRRLLDGVRAVVPDALPNGPDDDAHTLPGVANVTLPGCDADAMLMLLDAAGIDSSAGSACSAGVAQPSHVLVAMGRSAAAARSTLRFSLGHTSTAADVEALLAALPEAVRRARLAGSLAG